VPLAQRRAIRGARNPGHAVGGGQHEPSMGAAVPGVRGSAMVCIMSSRRRRIAAGRASSAVRTTTHSVRAPRWNQVREQRDAGGGEHAEGQHGGDCWDQARLTSAAARETERALALLRSKNSSVVRAHGTISKHADDVQDGQPGLTGGHQQPRDCQHRQREGPPPTRATAQRGAGRPTATATMAEAGAKRQTHGLPTDNRHKRSVRLQIKQHGVGTRGRASAARHALDGLAADPRNATADSGSSGPDQPPPSTAGLRGGGRVRCLEVGAGHSGGAVRERSKSMRNGCNRNARYRQTREAC